ncbi:hypothetical protein F3D20_27445 [Bacteroides ovatus]|nr:hypothetical protein F3D20_27445 [Bacteroides ovatus]
MKRLALFLLLQTCCSILMFAQALIFKPTSATINDSQGSYTSEHFDCSVILVTDNRTSVSIAIAGDKMTLYPNQYNKDTYIAIARQGNIELKIVAYRSSNSNNIFLVTMTTKNGNQSVTINFKP